VCGGIDEDVFGANKRKWEVSLLEAARGVFVGGDTSLDTHGRQYVCMRCSCLLEVTRPASQQPTGLNKSVT
jgi:hypothetical protein